MMFVDKLIYYSLLWAIFWIPFVAVPAGVFCKQFTDLGLELALLFWLIKLVIHRTTGFKKIGHGIDQAFLGIVIASALSIPFSFIKLWSIGDCLGLLVGIFSVYLIISVIKTKNEFYVLYASILCSSVIVAFLGLWQLPLIHDPVLAKNILLQPFLFLASSDHPSRICSTFIEYSGVNVYAAYLIAVIMLLITPLVLYYKELRPAQRIHGSLIAILLFADLALTKGRAAYIALFVALFYVFWQNTTLRKWLILGLVSVCTVSILFVPLVRTAIVDIVDPTSSSNQERIVIYGPALQQIMERPIFGFGDGHAGRNIVFHAPSRTWEESPDKKYFSFTSIQTVYDKMEYYKKKGIINIQRPHNIFLTTMIEMGIFGLLTLLFLFYTLIKAPLIFYREHAHTLEGIIALALSGTFLTVAVYGLFHDSLNARPYAILFWVLIGLTGTLFKVHKYKSTEYISQKPSSRSK